MYECFVLKCGFRLGIFEKARNNDEAARSVLVDHNAMCSDICCNLVWPMSLVPILIASEFASFLYA